MTEYIYQESDFISPKDYIHYNEMMGKYDWDPSSINDEKEFHIVLKYLASLIIRAPHFLPVYEYSYLMIETLDFDDQVVLDLSVEIEKGWFNACLYLTVKEELYNKLVPWGWQENRPYLRGMYNYGEMIWKVDNFDAANKIFLKLLEMNPDDQIGVRYSAKATSEEITHDHFDRKFMVMKNGLKCFDLEKLDKWYLGSL